MTDEATPTGAEAEVTQAEVKPTTNPRTAAIQQIAAQAHANVAEDLQEFDEATGEIAPRDDKGRFAKKDEPQVAEATPEPVKAEEPKDEPKLESIVVDGRKLEVPLDRVLEAGRRALQKESAADKRLQEAAHLKKQWEARIKELSPQGDTALPGEGVTTEGPATNGFDPAMLSETIDRTLDQKLYDREARKAAERFQKEFPEIAKDKRLMGLAGVMEDERLATVQALGDDLGDPWEAYRKHGDDIRRLVGYKAPVSEDRLDRKRQTASVPAASARTQAPQPTRPKTTSEIIEEQRKARHQRVA